MNDSPVLDKEVELKKALEKPKEPFIVWYDSKSHKRRRYMVAEGKLFPHPTKPLFSYTKAHALPYYSPANALMALSSCIVFGYGDCVVTAESKG